MIKARGRAGDGRPLVILGLSGESVTRLFADEPILLDLAELGLPPCLVVIVGGKTEDTIRQELIRFGLLETDDAPPDPSPTP